MNRAERRAMEAQQAVKAASDAASTIQEPQQQNNEPNPPAGEDQRPDGFVPPPRNEPRRMAIEEIMQKRGEPKDEPVIEPPAAEERLHSKIEAVPNVSVEQATAPEPVVPAIEMVRVKIDGEEMEVPKADVDEAGGVGQYQREKASEARLRKANELVAQTRQTQDQLAQIVQNLIQQAQNTTPAAPTITKTQFIQSKIDDIRFGTPEESAAALDEVMQYNAPQINPQTIVDHATNQMRRSIAVDNFAKEFQDIAANPLLCKLAVTLENERITNAGPRPDWNTFYRQIGNELRNVAGIRPSQTTPTLVAPVAATTDIPSQAPSEREARKASIVNLPTAAARAAPAAEEKPETREQILNSMRKARGIPTG